MGKDSTQEFSQVRPSSKSFNVSTTFSITKRPTYRDDIDMKLQREVIHHERRNGKLNKDWEAFTLTCADSKTHIAFVKMLLNEVERQFVEHNGGGGKGRVSVQEFVARRKLHRALGRIGADCTNALSQDDRLYGEYLTKISSHHFFEFRRKPSHSATPLSHVE